MKKYDDNHFILSNGTKFYAWDHIIGLNHDGDGWNIYDGFDGEIFSNITKNDRMDDGERKELNEIADYMIDLWKEFKKDITE